MEPGLRNPASRHRWQFLQHRQQPGHPVLHFVAVDDQINCPFLKEKFSTLETLRQGLAHGLLNHARAGKADQRTRLGDHHVTEKGKGC